MLPPPSLASPAGRYFDCIPGELGCRCGLLILGSSESVFPRAMEQAAEVCREGEIAPEECRGGGAFSGDRDESIPDSWCPRGTARLQDEGDVPAV